MAKSRPNSKLITRAVLARSTADALLIDRPKLPAIRGWFGFAAWSFFVALVTAGPIPTSAFSDLPARVRAHDASHVVAAAAPTHAATAVTPTADATCVVAQ